VEPGGVRAVREVVHHGGSAVILPRFPDGRILLIRQYRMAVGRLLWELPAGSIDPGETALQTARRELAEETGFRSRSWRKLLEFYPSPGFLDEKMTLFLARDIIPGPARQEADERILPRAFAMAEVLSLARAGKIRDAKTLLGLLCFDRWGSSGF
jgi:ADP-ribose pyrophosphatase